MVVVTHDLESAALIADRAVLLMGGHVVAVGDKDVVWGHPDDSVQDFLRRRLGTGGGDRNDIERMITI